MTTETKPATDEMKMWRDLASVSGLISATFSCEQIRAIVALVDAERGRAERAENGNTKLRERLVALRRACREVETDSDILAAQLTAAQQQIAALREALDEATLTVIYEALRFADWAAGEGICPDIEARPEPAEFLSAYIEAKGMTDADYADLPEYVRQALARIGGGA